ncbi:indoleacetamide hydrolase [Nitratireductor mangrovi]
MRTSFGLAVVTGTLALAAAAAAAEMTTRDMAAAVRDGTTTSAALVDAALAAAERNADLNAFVTLDNDGARTAAAAADAAADKSGALFGVPIVVKDNIASAGLPTSAGTAALKDWVPEADAPVLARLRAAGAILIGKTGLHELAFGITSNNATFGAIGNPWAPERFAGGSSGGSGAAVAAGIVTAGLGTDTGGSVRIPAALNGIAALRPTVGRYPGKGIVPISKTRDTAGPMARTVDDLVLLDGVITGGETSVEPVSLAEVRLGVAAPLNADLDPETSRVMDQALAALEKAGATLVPVDMNGLMELNGKVGFPLALHEAKTGLVAFLAENGTGVTIEELAAGIASPDVKFVFDELVLGPRAIPDAVYEAALHTARPQLQALYAETFAAHKLDALVFPTTPLPAQPIAGSDMNVLLNGREVPTFQTFIRNTDPGSNAGLPGISIPAGLTSDGLPVGLEIDGPSFSDRRLLAIALSIEAALGPIGAPPAR